MNSGREAFGSELLVPLRPECCGVEDLLGGLADERSSRSTEASRFRASTPGASEPTRIFQAVGAPEGGFPFAVPFALEPPVELEKPELFDGTE